MLDGACDPCYPVVAVGAQQLLASVLIGDLEHAPEGDFLADHPVVSSGSDDLVGPPSGCDLDGEHVLGSGLGVQGFGNVVGE